MSIFERKTSAPVDLIFGGEFAGGIIEAPGERFANVSYPTIATHAHITIFNIKHKAYAQNGNIMHKFIQLRDRLWPSGPTNQRGRGSRVCWTISFRAPNTLTKVEGRAAARHCSLADLLGPVIESYPSWHPLVRNYKDNRSPAIRPSLECGYRTAVAHRCSSTKKQGKPLKRFGKH